MRFDGELVQKILTYTRREDANDNTQSNTGVIDALLSEENLRFRRITQIPTVVPGDKFYKAKISIEPGRLIAPESISAYINTYDDPNNNLCEERDLSLRNIYEAKIDRNASVDFTISNDELRSVNDDLATFLMRKMTPHAAALAEIINADLANRIALGRGNSPSGSAVPVQLPAAVKKGLVTYPNEDFFHQCQNVFDKLRRKKGTKIITVGDEFVTNYLVNSVFGGNNQYGNAINAEKLLSQHSIYTDAYMNLVPSLSPYVTDPANQAAALQWVSGAVQYFGIDELSYEDASSKTRMPMSWAEDSFSGTVPFIINNMIWTFDVEVRINNCKSFINRNMTINIYKKYGIWTYPDDLLLLPGIANANHIIAAVLNKETEA